MNKRSLFSVPSCYQGSVQGIPEPPLPLLFTHLQSLAPLPLGTIHHHFTSYLGLLYQPKALRGGGGGVGGGWRRKATCMRISLQFRTRQNLRMPCASKPVTPLVPWGLRSPLDCNQAVLGLWCPLMASYGTVWFPPPFVSFAVEGRVTYVP